ncbi:hypothetical protein [uncultured Cytophaga sp.]|nr:hypothetical protein [uncultured Cytophaga sp.]
MMLKGQLKGQRYGFGGLINREGGKEYGPFSIKQAPKGRGLTN